MRTPRFVKEKTVDALCIATQSREAVRFKATIPVERAHDRLLAPLYAEMLERGTKHKTRKEFAAALDALGARLAVASDRFGITIDATTLAATIPSLLRLIAEMLREPAFPPQEIARVHKQYLQALHDEQDDAREVAYGAFARLVYPKTHPCYRPTTAERRAFLKSVTRKTYADFHARLFQGRVTVSVAGSPKAQKATLALFFSLTKGEQNEKRRTPPRAAAKAASRGGRSAHTPVPGKTNIETYLGGPLPLSLADPAYLPFQFGLAVLGKWGGFSGRLMSTVREELGLTYSIYARSEGATKTHNGAWYIFTFFTPKDFQKGITATKQEITKIAARGITEKELLRFKELLTNQFTLAHESDAKTLALYHDALASGLTPQEVQAQYQRIPGLTRAEINTALKTYLNPAPLRKPADGGLTLATAGPMSSSGKPLL